jgi:hypothetical protein
MAKAFQFKYNKKFFDDLSKQVEGLEKGVTKSVANKVGVAAVKEMKRMIGAGLSPIRGKGRFPAYKDTDRYPGRVRRDYPRKKNTPVNLKLSGDMLKSLDYESVKDGAAYKTLVDYMDSQEKKKEQGHREGVNSQPRRPTIPQGNEKPAKSIEEVCLDIYLEALEKYASRSIGKR